MVSGFQQPHGWGTRKGFWGEATPLDLFQNYAGDDEFFTLLFLYQQMFSLSGSSVVLF